METILKILLKLPLTLRNVILDLLYLLCDIELFEFDSNYTISSHAWNVRNRIYYPICKNPFNNNIINYGYKHNFKDNTHFFGKVQNKQIMLIR
jgi:hypothetical protein